MSSPEPSQVEPTCPGCGAQADSARPAARCPFCGTRAARGAVTWWHRLLWLTRAYRAWSLGVFAAAVLPLLASRDDGKILMSLFVLGPFAAALVLAYWSRDRPSPWLVSFLVLVDFGVIIAPMHQVFPFLNLAPDIPRTQNRIISWYFLVYIGLQFVVLPPVAFSRSLRTALRREVPTLRPSICVAGFAVWGLLVTIIGLFTYQSWLK